MANIKPPFDKPNRPLTYLPTWLIMGLSNLSSINLVRAFFVALKTTQYITRGQFITLGFCRIMTRRWLVDNGKFDTYSKIRE